MLVRNVVAGPFEGLDKHDLPTQLCPFAAEVLRQEARHLPGHYDLIHSHYWLSGQVGWLARDRWRVPQVHTAHTLAAVKNAHLAAGDTPNRPRARSARSRSSPRPTDWSPTPARRPASWSSCTAPSRSGSMWCCRAPT